MNILENYTKTLDVSNKRIKKHRSLNEDGPIGAGMVSNAGSGGSPSGGMNTVNGRSNVIQKNENPNQEDETGNHHINNFLKANKEQKNRDVMSQVERVENGIDRMHKVIEKLRKIIHELKHTYFTNEYPSAASNYDGKSLPNK